MLRQITFAPTFTGWQRAARRALAAEYAPGEILWQELSAEQSFLDIAEEQEFSAAPAPAARVPKEFISAAKRVACHSDAMRWELLYRILWRLTHGERHLLELAMDDDVQKFQQMDKAIRHDVHKMRAFVRFRAVQHASVDWFVAWFEPKHHIVELNAPFFVDRFAKMCWSILTPDLCAHWDQKNLTFTQGVTRAHAPDEDATEALWIAYYANIFNPARVKIHAMEKEMPKHYWKNLPEAAVIPALLNDASARVTTMLKHSPTTIHGTTLAELREEARGCTACPLYQEATQTVFGEGLSDAKLVLVGEQPGDREDLAGQPFIGPAGQLLDRAMQEAGINRAEVYLTNAVKHFKFVHTGKRRLHQKPGSREIVACRPWLKAELGILKPKVLVCLGGTAAQSVLGADIKVMRDRGHFLPSEFCPLTLVTMHPSSLLRAPDEATRAQNYQLFVTDLQKARERVN